MTETTVESKSRSRWSTTGYWLFAIAGTLIGTGWYIQSGMLNSEVGELLDSGADADLAAIEIRHDDGRVQTLADFHGRYVLLDFWASWCPYCRISMPAFETLQRNNPDTLTVLAVNTQEPIEDGRAWLQEQQLTLPLVRSPELVRQLDVQVLPTSVLLDPKGRRIWATVGFVPLVTPALLEKEIKP